MVRQTKIVLGVGDIANIRLHCVRCTGGSFQALNDGQSRIPDKCPSCHETWNEQRPGDTGLSSANLLLHVLQEVSRDEANEKAPVVFEFEFDDAGSEASSPTPS